VGYGLAAVPAAAIQGVWGAGAPQIKERKTKP